MLPCVSSGARVAMKLMCNIYAACEIYILDEAGADVRRVLGINKNLKKCLAWFPPELFHI